MDVERGVYGSLPYAAVGSGSPLVVLAGLMPATGVAGDAMVGAMIHPLSGLAGSRRLVVLNRRTGLPSGMTMAELAGEHADALREAFSAPVDLVGTSTGGSIAAQLAADHGDLVGRLVLISAVGWLLAGRLVHSREDWADLATTIEAEDGFDLATCATPIAAATLIIAGADDRFYSPALFEQTAELIPGSNLNLISGRGHITVTRDRRFTPTLAAFLS